MTEFEQAVQEMRKWQKAYFAAARGTDEKQFTLQQSKKWESRVDTILQEIQSGQGSLMEVS